MNPNPESRWRHEVRDRGAAGEAAAARWLQDRDVEILTRNYRCRLGEIDIIGRDGEVLAVIEVRSRGGADPVGAAASVTLHKQRRIIAATRHFLMRHPELADNALRFDVIAIDGDRLQWLRNAFISD